MRTRLAFVVSILMSVAVAAVVSQREQERQRALPHYRKGFEHLRAEAWPEAAKSFQQAVDSDEKFEMAYYGLGRALMPQKKFVEAAAAFAKCRDLYRAQAGRHFTNQQEAQRFRNDNITGIDEAIRQYQQGPQTMQVQQALRQLNEHKRQIQDQIQRGMNITIDNTVPAYVLLSLGSAYFRMGRLADAEREYKATIAADPKSGEAHNNLAVVYLETGRPADAERSVAAAEKAGYKVHPQLKQDIKDRKKET